MDGFRADYGGYISDVCERGLVMRYMGNYVASFTKNNQLRTGADKGNPTV